MHERAGYRVRIWAARLAERLEWVLLAGGEVGEHIAVHVHLHLAAWPRALAYRVGYMAYL